MDQNWKAEYWDFMMDENYEKGFELKYQYLPEHFYKYRKLSSQTINCISENYI